MNPTATSGQRFGPYRTERLLGQGSVGAVYLAEGAPGTPPVALKVFSQAELGDGDAAGAEARDRFVAEARVLSGVTHPDIVAVLAAGEQLGRRWLAMELVPGVSLERYTRPARLLPEPVALAVAARVAGALAFAHRAGIVHRDVKPANVLVHWPSDTVKLADFGLARLADAERTRTGLVLGSPAYMAPELLAGAEPTPASDLYALGVTLFQLLSGRLPHDSASMGELLRQVASEPAPDLRTLRPELPGALAALVARLLAKRRADRPADGDALAAELRALAQPS